jgi:hypothetical protein
MTWENAMRKAILLMLFCGSANAAMYSCVDEDGKKVLRSEPCEQNEKQQPIVIKADPSYYVINSTGEKQVVDSYQPKQATKSVAQSAARKSTASSQPIDRKQSNWDKAMAWANQGDSGESRGTRLGLAMRAENGGTTPPDNPAITFSIPAPLAIHTPQPSVITSCDSGGCWDDLGNRYNGDSTGITFFGPSGACEKIGDIMQCP